MSEPIQIACPHCDQNLKIAHVTAGKQVRCPQCHGFIRVPEDAGLQSDDPTLWMVRAEGGKIYGPVSRSELEQWVNEGRVHAQCHISAESAQQWIWAAEMFPHLAPVQAETPPAPSYARPYHNPGPVSDRSRLVAGLLGLLLPLAGFHGIHRLYTGHIGLGILMLITCGGCGIWQLIDVILVFAGSVTDIDGRPLQA